MPDSVSGIPSPGPVQMNSAGAAVLVLDLTAPAQGTNPLHQALLPALAEFLERARTAGVPIVFTGARTQLGRPVEPALQRRDDEPLLYPDAFDKFKPGELLPILTKFGTRDLVITGGAANMAVMYTATAAARDHHLQVYIPLDGLYSHDAYRYEYALYQLTVLPGSTIPPKFTTLAQITFD
jgi:nicotinamidase-related amidase